MNRDWEKRGRIGSPFRRLLRQGYGVPRRPRKSEPDWHTPRRARYPDITQELYHSGLLFRNPRVFQQESLHIGKNEAGIERTRTVDIPDAAFPID